MRGGLGLGHVAALGQPVPRGDLRHAGQGRAEHEGALVVGPGVLGDDLGDRLRAVHLDGVEARAHLGDAGEVGLEDHPERRALARDELEVGRDGALDPHLVVAADLEGLRARGSRGCRSACRAGRGRGRACRGSAGRAPAWRPRRGRRSRPWPPRGSRTGRRRPGPRRAAGRGARCAASAARGAVVCVLVMRVLLPG